MNCCQSAILSFAFGVWVEATFSEVDVYVERAVLLHALQNSPKGENIVQEKSPDTVVYIVTSEHSEHFSSRQSQQPRYTPIAIALCSTLGLAHLWDVHFFVVFVTAIPVLPCGPVSINQVPVVPKQCLCIVEV